MERVIFEADSTVREELIIAACAAMNESVSGKKIKANEVSLMPPCKAREIDDKAAEEAGRRIAYLLTAGQCEKGGFAYAEASMVSTSFPKAEFPSSYDFGEEEADNSLDIHPYYVRFSADSRGWLDLVTAKRIGNQIITKPVSVKALHGWLKHALKYDPDVFAAAIIDTAAQK